MAIIRARCSGKVWSYRKIKMWLDGAFQRLSFRSTDIHFDSFEIFFCLGGLLFCICAKRGKGCMCCCSRGNWSNLCWGKDWKTSHHWNHCFPDSLPRLTRFCQNFCWNAFEKTIKNTFWQNHLWPNKHEAAKSRQIQTNSRKTFFLRILGTLSVHLKLEKMCYSVWLWTKWWKTKQAASDSLLFYLETMRKTFVLRGNDGNIRLLANIWHNGQSLDNKKNLSQHI